MRRYIPLFPFRGKETEAYEGLFAQGPYVQSQVFPPFYGDCSQRIPSNLTFFQFASLL